MTVDRLRRTLAIVALSASGIVGTSLSAQEAGKCAAPTPVISLNYGSRYAEYDAQRATLDPFRDAAVDAALAPVETFIRRLSGASGRLYSVGLSDRAERANCILDQIGMWARANALSKLETETSNLTIGARFAALALVTWQAVAYAPNHPDREVILAWLSTRIEDQIAFWADAPPGARKGNLRAWAALAAAAVAIQTDRRDFAEWAHASLEEIMCTATKDGSLPQEMSRGRYALHYQLHAVAPIVTTSALLELQSIPAGGLCDNALHRIVAFTVSDLRSGQKTRAITGVEQTLVDGSTRLRPYQLAWLEQYLVLVPNEELATAIDPLRPLNYSKLGGNQTEIWRRE